MCERGVPGGALNLNSTGHPDHGRYGDLSLQAKIPTAQPGTPNPVFNPRETFFMGQLLAHVFSVYPPCSFYFKLLLRFVVCTVITTETA
jgi:hypothetical protein